MPRQGMPDDRGPQVKLRVVARHVIEACSTFRDPALLPRRDWLYGQHYIRGAVSATVADGGIGKSTLAIAEGIAMATGRNLLGVAVPKPLAVLYLNLEESADEIERRVAAVCQQHDIAAGDLTDQFYFQSGLNHPVIIAKMERGAIITDDDLDSDLMFAGFDVVIVDPFNRCHGVPENDNTAIAAVVNAWAAIAARFGMSVEIVHHVRKAPYGGQAESGVADARGASALVNAARSVRVLNRMTESEAGKAGVEDHWQYFRADDGKANYAPSGAASWYRLKPMVLANGDSAATVLPWHYPGAFAGVTAAHLEKVCDMARAGDYRADPQSPEWIGVAIAEVLDLDPEDDRQRIKAVLKVWMANGALKVVKRKDETRRERSFVEPGA